MEQLQLQVMAEHVPQLSLEACFQYALLRAELRSVVELEQLRAKALQLVDMLEMQRRTTNAMLQQSFLKPRPQLPPPAAG